MRASYECSVMGALTLAGIQARHFRWIYGVSAGAASAAYYIAGQMGLGYEVWKRHLTGRKFIQHATNLLLRKPIFHLQYLEDVYTRRDPLNVERVIAHPTEFRVVLTHCRSGRAHYVRPTAETCIPLLMTTCAYPPFHAPKLFAGEWFADGALSDPIPIMQAIHAGAKNILVVSTTPRAWRATRDRTMRALSWVAFPLNRRMRMLYDLNWEIYNVAKELIDNPPSGVRIISIHPEAELSAWPLDTNYDHLNAAMRNGELDAERVMRECDLVRCITGRIRVPPR